MAWSCGRVLQRCGAHSATVVDISSTVGICKRRAWRLCYLVPLLRCLLGSQRVCQKEAAFGAAQLMAARWALPRTAECQPQLPVAGLAVAPAPALAAATRDGPGPATSRKTVTLADVNPRPVRRPKTAEPRARAAAASASGFSPSGVLCARERGASGVAQSLAFAQASAAPMSRDASSTAGGVPFPAFSCAPARAASDTSRSSMHTRFPAFVQAHAASMSLDTSSFAGVAGSPASTVSGDRGISIMMPFAWTPPRPLLGDIGASDAAIRDAASNRGARSIAIDPSSVAPAAAVRAALAQMKTTCVCAVIGLPREVTCTRSVVAPRPLAVCPVHKCLFVARCPGQLVLHFSTQVCAFFLFSRTTCVRVCACFFMCPSCQRTFRDWYCSPSPCFSTRAWPQTTRTSASRAASVRPWLLRWRSTKRSMKRTGRSRAPSVTTGRS